jgi:hypothetical protein
MGLSMYWHWSTFYTGFVGIQDSMGESKRYKESCFFFVGCSKEKRVGGFIFLFLDISSKKVKTYFSSPKFFFKFHFMWNEIWHLKNGQILSSNSKKNKPEFHHHMESSSGFFKLYISQEGIRAVSQFNSRVLFNQCNNLRLFNSVKNNLS